MPTAPTFPAGPSLLGCVAGAHPKLLLIEKNGRYLLDEGDTTTTKRHDTCANFVIQLHAYCLSKLHHDALAEIPQLLHTVHESLEKNPGASLKQRFSGLWGSYETSCLTSSLV